MYPDSTSIDASVNARLSSVGLASPDDDPDDMDYDDDARANGS